MTVFVHGLGHIGLATASLFGNNGHEVIGYDTDEEVLDGLRRGTPDVTEAELEAYVRRALSHGLSLSDEVVPADYHLICVPTPFNTEATSADLRYVKQAGEAVAAHLRPDDVVVLESTVPPRTTRSVLVPILEQSGLTAGTEFGVAYAPETVLPGNTVTELRTNDRILGGINRASAESTRELYEPAIKGAIHLAPNATTAEFVKLVQNAFRDVNIAFANELALVARDYDIDVRDAIQLANLHPRVDILNPGPGVGGHCLPVDPLFLKTGSDETALVDCARRVNDRMPSYVVDRLSDTVGTLAGRTVAVLGIAYKGNVSDTRNSPGLSIARELDAALVDRAAVADGGLEHTGVRLTDPHVTDDIHDLAPLSAALEEADAAVIAAGHDEFAELDPARVGDLLAGSVILDTVDILDADRWGDHGLQVVKL